MGDAGLHYSFRVAIWIGALLVLLGFIPEGQALSIAGAILAAGGMVACAIEEKSKG